jgi:2,3-bisphosphoglycerate-dependent phosphoglycerate mutase
MPQNSAQITEFILVRHGETDWNKEKRIQGSTDIALNADGLAQAQRLTPRIAAMHQERKFNAAYSSDQIRARVTAEYAAQSTELTIQLDSAFRERNYGVLERLTYAEMHLREPAAAAGLLSRAIDYAIPDGESTTVFYDRVTTALAQVLRNHPGQRVLIVAHGGTIDMMRRFLTNTALTVPRDFEILNATIHIIHRETESQRGIIRMWNDIAVEE